MIPGNTLFQRSAVTTKMTAAATSIKYPNSREGWCPSEKFASVPKASSIPQNTSPNHAIPASQLVARRSPDLTCSLNVACHSDRRLPLYFAACG